MTHIEVLKERLTTYSSSYRSISEADNKIIIKAHIFTMPAIGDIIDFANDFGYSFYIGTSSGGGAECRLHLLDQ